MEYILRISQWIPKWHLLIDGVRAATDCFYRVAGYKPYKPQFSPSNVNIESSVKCHHF
jgi:hypothetical protein